MIEVTLTWSEVEQAAVAAVHREIIARADGLGDAHGFSHDRERWDVQIEGCAAEVAVARTLGYYWTPWARHYTGVRADVGNDVQVRLRRGDQPDPHLLLHKTDPVAHRYVLVGGSIPTFRLFGWIRGVEALRDQYWGDPRSTGRPAYWVPAADLDPMHLLTED